MADQFALYDDEINLPASAIDESITMASVDKGCSLLKALVGRRNGDRVTLRCLTFKNSDFDKAMEWMKSNIKFEKDPVVRVTGVGGAELQEQMAKALDCQTKWVDEFDSQSSGIDVILKHGDDKEICYPQPEVHFANSSIDFSESWQKVKETVNENVDHQKTDDSYPIVFSFMGSSMGSTLITKEEGCRLVNGNFVCGRTFLGLANMLLGTSDFKEIDRLARKGVRARVDNISHELFEETNNQTYRMFPGEMSIFPFGKMDENANKENATREDIAAGLLNMFVELLTPCLFTDLSKYGSKRLVVGGNLIRSQFFRETFASAIQWRLRLMPDLGIRYLKTGHTAAIGAMLLQSQSK